MTAGGVKPQFRNGAADRFAARKQQGKQMRVAGRLEFMRSLKPNQFGLK
ncbi:MAG TPA: hypothetical protein VGH23_10570 [Rhizomicrobium sp.]